MPKPSHLRAQPRAHHAIALMSELIATCRTLTRTCGSRRHLATVLGVAAAAAGTRSTAAPCWTTCRAAKCALYVHQVSALLHDTYNTHAPGSHFHLSQSPAPSIHPSSPHPHKHVRTFTHLHACIHTCTCTRTYTHKRPRKQTLAVKAGNGSREHATPRDNFPVHVTVFSSRKVLLFIF